MISQYYYLGEDEIDNAIGSLNNMLMIKRIEKSLGCIEYLRDLYRGGYIPTRRDHDAEGYNGVEESPLGILMLDAIFTENYYSFNEVITNIEDEESTKEELDLIYYDFRISPRDKLSYEDVENIGVYPRVLSLSSENISKSLKIAEILKFKHGNDEIINKIQDLANDCLICSGELTEASLIDLNSYKIDFLFNDISMYEIEIASVNFLDLEEHCRDIVGRYSQWID